MTGRLLEGKIALITGSTRGIGWATAEAFAEQGATVIVNGRASREAVDARAAELRERFGAAATGICADVSEAAAVKGCYQEIFRQYKRLDVLVNNAGIMQDALLGMIPEPLIRKSLDVNLLGSMLHLQEASRLMGRNRSGSIVNLSSIVGARGKEGQAVYSTTKAGIIGLTLAAAKELAPQGIRVNAVTPGLIRTDLLRDLPEQKLAEAQAAIRMGRIGEPRDVANAIVFLASDLAAYVTGQVLGVDGGMIL